MPNITMCVNKECPLRDSCYRATAEQKERGQSYERFEPWLTWDAAWECDHYIARAKPTGNCKP